MIIKEIHGHVNFRIFHIIHYYAGCTIIRDSRVRDFFNARALWSLISKTCLCGYHEHLKLWKTSIQVSTWYQSKDQREAVSSLVLKKSRGVTSNRPSFWPLCVSLMLTHHNKNCFSLLWDYLMTRRTSISSNTSIHHLDRHVTRYARTALRVRVLTHLATLSMIFYLWEFESLLISPTHPSVWVWVLADPDYHPFDIISGSK